MHSCRDDDPRSIYLERSLSSLLKNPLNIRFSLIGDVPSVGDGHEAHFPGLAGAAEHLVMEIYLLVSAVLEGEGVEEIFAVLVGVGVGECELHPILLLESEAEG